MTRKRAFASRLSGRDCARSDGPKAATSTFWAGDEPKLARAYAAELVGAAPEIIVAHAPMTVAAVQQQTRSLPIVFVQVADPVGQGFVASLAQPGGNTTGFASFEDSISAKWLELLKELVPQASRVGIIRVPGKASSSQFLMRAIEILAASLKVQLTRVEVRDLAEIDGAFDTLSRVSIEGLIVMPDPTTLTYRARIIELTTRERKIPAVYPYRYFAADGGLVSYGPNGADIWRRTAFYVDRILKGAKAAG